jgi:hypothetical protein
VLRVGAVPSALFNDVRRLAAPDVSDVTSPHAELAVRRPLSITGDTA